MLKNDKFYGKIHKRYDVWCAGCMDSKYLNAQTPMFAKIEAEKAGWKLIKRRWHCPQCVLEIDKGKV